MDWAGSPLSTRDTVDTCTPAAWAMSTSRDARRRAPPGTPDLAGAFLAVPARTGPPPAGIPEVMTNHPAGRASSGTAAVHHEHAALQVTRVVRGQKRHSIGDLRR